jgi:hypothetical protein
MVEKPNYEPKKLFTVEEANRSLPLVAAIVRDLAALSWQLTERRQRLSQLAAGREVGQEAGDLHAEEWEQVRLEMQRDVQELEVYQQELKQLGVEPTSSPEGIVDFPAVMDDRLVFLCWKLGESEVMHWHEVDAGFAGRSRLATAHVVTGTAPSR